MIATHNIKVNGRWYAAGEEYEPEVPQDAEEAKAEPEVQAEAVPEEEPKTAPKPKTTTRRKKTSE